MNTQPLADFITDTLSRYGLEHFRQWIGREPLTDDLTPAIRNQAMLAMVDGGSPLRDVYEAQRGIRKLWDAALDAGAIETLRPNRLFHVAFDTRPIAPWSSDEFGRLIKATRGMKYGTPYTMHGIHRFSYWECFVRITQQTRLQRAVIQEIRWDNIDLENGICDLTGHRDVGLSFELSPETVEVLKRLQYPQRETVLPYHSARNVFNTAFHRLLVKAKVDYRPGKQPRGSDRRPMRKEVKVCGT